MRCLFIQICTNSYRLFTWNRINSIGTICTDPHEWLFVQIHMNSYWLFVRIHMNSHCLFINTNYINTFSCIMIQVITVLVQVIHIFVWISMNSPQNILEWFSAIVACDLWIQVIVMRCRFCYERFRRDFNVKCGSLFMWLMSPCTYNISIYGQQGVLNTFSSSCKFIIEIVYDVNCGIFIMSILLERLV